MRLLQRQQLPARGQSDISQASSRCALVAKQGQQVNLREDAVQVPCTWYQLVASESFRQKPRIST